MKKQKIKQMPSLKTDAEAEQFVESADLLEYDLSGFTPVKFEFEAKIAALNMHLPQSLLNAVKIRAEAEGMPYTRYIRLVLEQAVRNPNG
ncbi:BrnA antitoxin family protein [Desulfosarcina sp. OttesenSCG-928-B08]|nr:BrnA antitoxin family protein [Desulfosarcina sp. OttesenSCG-928-B08]